VKSNIKAVYFDVGGVLLEDFIEKKILDLARQYGKNAAEMLQLRKKYRPLADAGKISDMDFWHSVLRDVGVAASEKDCELAAYMRPVAGGLELAKKLKKWVIK